MRARLLYALILFVPLLLGNISAVYELPLNSPAGAPSSAVYDGPFPDYYRGPSLQEIYIQTFDSPDSEFTAMQGGSPEAMDWSLTPTQISTLATNARYNVNTSNDLGTVEVVFSNGRFPSNVTSYRQAISLMINKQDVVNTKLPGIGGVMDDQLNPGYPAPWRNTSYPWTQNITAAISTLSSAGWYFGYWATPATAGTTDTLSTYSCPINPMGVGAGNPGHNVLECWKYDGTEFGLGMHDYVLNWTNTIFYARQDDAVRDYIGTQIGLTVGANKNTYPGVDRLFSVVHISSFESSRLAYSAPDCPADSQGHRGYESNACVGAHPAFSMYTQRLTSGIPDPSAIFFHYFSDTHLDVSGYNYGHWNNATMFSYLHQYIRSTDQSCTMNPCEGAVYQYERDMNGLITYLSYWDPIYYQKDYVPATERVTGASSGENSGIPNGAWFESNIFSFYRAHLKGRTFGGSLRIGDYIPIHDLNPFDAATGNWPYNFAIFNKIYDSMMRYDPNLGSTANPFVPDLAINMTVTALTNPRLPVGYSHSYYHPTSTAPYWSAYSGPYATLSGEGQKIVFNVYPNAKWHDGSPITTNDILWNIVTDSMDLGNMQQGAFTNLADVNVTGPYQVTLWFNQSSYYWATAASGVLYAPPTPWINLKQTQSGYSWALTDGKLSTLSVNSRTDLQLSAGALNTLDGSSAYMFDVAYCVANPSTCFSAANAAGDVFAFKANNNWWLRNPNKNAYSTGIILMDPFLPSATFGNTVHLKVAIVNGNNTKGLTWNSTYHDWAPDPGTTSDTSGATVTACMVDVNGNGCSSPVPLTQLGGPTSLYEGDLTITALGINYVQITASKAGSLTTVYGPSGSSQLNAVGGSKGSGIAWEGDAYHTYILPRLCCLPPYPVLFGGFLFIPLLVAPVLLFRRWRHAQKAPRTTARNLDTVGFENRSI